MESQTRTIIDRFYTAFANKQADEMVAQYDDEVVFTDPGFGRLEGDRAKAMWRMLIERGGQDLTVQYEIVDVSGNEGRVNWTADYRFGPKRRKVINHVQAHLLIHNGKIVRHDDQFSFWKWSRQALGLPGLLLGWSSFLKKSVQEKTNKVLSRYLSKNQEYTHEGKA